MQIQMTPEQFAAAVARLKKDYKIVASTPSGQLSRQGVTVTYIFDGTSLHVDVLKKPFFVGEGYVESQITAWFAGS